MATTARGLGWMGAGLAMAALAGLVACGDDASGSGTAQGGAPTTTTEASATSGAPSASAGGGDGGATATGVATGVTQGPGPVAVSSSASAGGAPAGCDPPADPSSFHAREAIDYATFQPVSMCEYRGEVVLIVNVAAL